MRRDLKSFGFLTDYLPRYRAHDPLNTRFNETHFLYLSRYRRFGELGDERKDVELVLVRGEILHCVAHLCLAFVIEVIAADAGLELFHLFEEIPILQSIEGGAVEGSLAVAVEAVAAHAFFEVEFVAVFDVAGEGRWGHEGRQGVDVVEGLAELLFGESGNGGFHLLAVKVVGMVPALSVAEFLNLLLKIPAWEGRDGRRHKFFFPSPIWPWQVAQTVRKVPPD